VQSGEEVMVVDPTGPACRVRIETASSECVEATVLSAQDRSQDTHVTLVQGLPKGDKMDLVVEKAVEVGVEAIVPAVFERSVVSLDEQKALRRVERWRRIAEAAAKQSQRNIVPRVEELADLERVLALVESADAALVPWEDEADSAPGIGAALESVDAKSDWHLVVVVGPEGGLTAEEVQRMRAAGGIAVSLGRTVLKSETAGILSAALCVYVCGGLGGRPRG